MPSTSALLAFAVACLVLAVVPGPSVLFVVGRAFALGRRAAMITVAGNTAGASIQVVVVALGFGAVAAQSVAVFTVLKLVGAAYLVYLGIHAIRTRGDLGAMLAGPADPVRRKVFLQGMVVGVTNPKALVFFAAVLPQFVDPSQGNTTAQMLLLGLLFGVIASTSDCVWGLAAGTARQWFATSPARLRRVGGAGGVMMIVMGAGLAVSGRKD